MKKGIFICFVGIDGSGKTTLAKRLEQDLKRSGISCKYAWCGWRGYNSFLFKPFAKLIKKFYDNNEKLKSVTNAKIPGTLALLDYILSLSEKSFLSLYTYDIFIADRYIYDMLVGFTIANSEITYIQKFLLDLFPKPDIIFFLDVPVEIAFSRKNDIPSTDYLVKRKKVYMSILNLPEVKILDGTQNLEDLLNTILTEIEKCQRLGL